MLCSDPSLDISGKILILSFIMFISLKLEQMIECLTRNRRAAGSSLTGVTALSSLSKTHLS